MKTILFLWMCFQFSWAYSQITLVSTVEYTLEDGASIGSGTYSNGTLNARVFAQENILTYNGYQYCAFYHTNTTLQREVMVGRRNLCSSNWEFLTIGNYIQTANNLHNVISLGICKVDGTIHLAFDHHNTNLKYTVSELGLANRPNDFQWDPMRFYPVRACLNPPLTSSGIPLPCSVNTNITGVTYPRFVSAPNGNLNLVYRSAGGSGSGNSYIAYYRGETRAWQDEHVFLEDSGQGYPVPCPSNCPNTSPTTNRSAYFNDLTYDKKGRLHVTWTWRELLISGCNAYNHDLMYAYSDDHGNTWYNNSGAMVGNNGSIPDPITDADTDIIVFLIPPTMSLINSGGQAIDHLGQPHVVTLQRTTPTCPPLIPQPYDFTSHVHYWRNPSGQWSKEVIPTNGDRAKLYADRAGNLYMSYVEREFPANALSRPVVKIATAGVRGNWLTWTQLFQGNRECHNNTPHIDRELLKDEGVVSVTYNFYDGTTNANPNYAGEFFVRDIFTNQQFNPSLTLFPQEDAFVRSGNDANLNFGSQPNLYVSKLAGGSLERTYLKFDLQPLLSSGNVVSAKLVLKKKGAPNNAEYRFNLLDDDSWDENLITYNSPPLGSVSFLGSTTSTTCSIEFDVTNQVLDELDQDGLISILVGRKNSANFTDEFYSKDSPQYGLTPTLVVEVLSRCPQIGPAKYHDQMLEDLNGGEVRGLSPLIIPNPSRNGLVEVSSLHELVGNPLSIEVYNTSGKIVLEKQIANLFKSSIQLDVSMLDGGLYIVKLQSVGRGFHLRMLIQ